jgi:hypothetical protein
MISWLVLVRLRRNFFVFYAAKPFSGIRARSMRRYFTRVKRNNVVAGVDVFVANFLFVYFLMSRDSGIEAA